MKSAVLALLFAAVSGQDAENTNTDKPAGRGHRGDRGDKEEDFGLSDAQKMEWFKLITEDMDRMDDLPRGSPLRQMWLKWMRGDAKDFMKMMKGMMYKDGGAWDNAAGKDGRMTLDEATKMDAAIRQHIEEKYDTKYPKRPEGYFKRAYDVYNALGDGEGFTKDEAKKADKIIERIRRKVTHWKPTKEQMKTFRPIWEHELEKWDELPEDSKAAEFIEKWLNYRAEREMKQVEKAMYKDGGMFDQYAGDDKMMDIKEARAMNDFFRKAAGKEAGIEIEGYSDEEFKAMFDAYDSLSEGAGISKMDGMTATGIMHEFRNRRISETEFDKFYAMAEMQHKYYIDDLDEDSEAYKYYLNYLENGKTKEESKMEKDLFKEFDKNGDRRLQHGEWMRAVEKTQNGMKKMLGDDAPEWSHGDQEFFWTMANSVKNGGWNQWGSHADGVSLKDLRRLDKIMRELFQAIEEDSDDSDSDSDSDSDDGDDESADDDAGLLLLI